jgi:imidazolonepropionase-like amidohydrolase
MASIVIENCDVIDGMGAPPRRMVDVVIEGNRVTEVASSQVRTDLSEPGAVRIDGTGKTVMPGLIDAHCHMTYGESMTQEEQDIFTSVEGRTLRAAWNVQKVLSAGVTGISQPGGSYFIGVAVRDGIKSGHINGPRMTSAGRYITTSNGLTDWYPDDVGTPEGSIGIRCNTLGEMIAEVRRQVKNGVDFVKLADSPYGEYQSFRDEELVAIADLCHQLNKRCTIHARGDAEVNAAARANFDWIMHGNVMTRETCELLVEKQIPLVPTLLLLEVWAVYGPAIGSPRPIVEGCRRMLERTRSTLHMAHEVGVKFVIGTDTGFAMTPYGEWHAKELELLMKYAGVTELEAIQAATYNAGLVLNLEGEVGGVAPGLLADLLVIDGDPSQDITILQDPDRIETIIVDGEIARVDRSVKAWPNLPSYTYAGRYLTREVAQSAMESNGSMYGGEATADAEGRDGAPPNTVATSMLSADPIGE